MGLAATSRLSAPPDASSARCPLRGARLPRVARLLGGSAIVSAQGTGFAGFGTRQGAFLPPTRPLSTMFHGGAPPLRRRKAAADRRSQRLRAEGRGAQRLLRAFAAVRECRGGQLTPLAEALSRALGDGGRRASGHAAGEGRSPGSTANEGRRAGAAAASGARGTSQDQSPGAGPARGAHDGGPRPVLPGLGGAHGDELREAPPAPRDARDGDRRRDLPGPNSTRGDGPREVPPAPRDGRDVTVASAAGLRGFGCGSPPRFLPEVPPALHDARGGGHRRVHPIPGGARGDGHQQGPPALRDAHNGAHRQVPPPLVFWPLTDGSFLASPPTPRPPASSGSAEASSGLRRGPAP